MRVLIVTNYFGTGGSGGEEQSCQQVVEGLNERGHVTLVLTSRPPAGDVPVEADGVHRGLFPEMDSGPWRNSITFFTQRKYKEKYNLRCLERVINQFKPDLIYVWGMWNLHRSIAALAEALMRGKVVYRFATYWPTLPSQNAHYWRANGRTWFSRVPKKILAPLALALLARDTQTYDLRFERSMCVSAATRAKLVEAGIPVETARVIYTGLRVERYPDRPARGPKTGQPHCDLLYAGRIAPDKGLATALEALSKLVHDQGRRHVRLALVGAGSPDYERYLRQVVGQLGLANHVLFQGWQPQEAMPTLLQAHDVLLLPSIWPEPFARIVLEGMASGLVVVATRTGGTPEVIADGENGLLFAPGDSRALAERLAQLIDNPEYSQSLARAGRQTVLERFTHTAMMNEIEAYLAEVAGGPSDIRDRALEPIRIEVDGRPV